MNHLGDTNKMSDTPRMNAARNAAMEHMTGDVWRVGCQLERELNEWKRWCKEKEQALDDLAKVFSQQQDRIKRLEELARTIERDFDHDEDAHRYGTTCRVCDAEDLLKENKAKENKP